MCPARHPATCGAAGHCVVRQRRCAATTLRPCCCSRSAADSSDGVALLLAQQRHSIVAVPLPALRQQQKRNVAVSRRDRDRLARPDPALMLTRRGGAVREHLRALLPPRPCVRPNSIVSPDHPVAAIAVGAGAPLRATPWAILAERPAARGRHRRQEPRDEWPRHRKTRYLPTRGPLLPPHGPQRPGPRRTSQSPFPPRTGAVLRAGQFPR